MKNETVTRGRYRHYKGNTYDVIDVARHSETGEELVVYRQWCHPYGLWVRPLAIFFESVEAHGKKVPRFELIAPVEDGVY
jgi:hypothetical protein